MSTIGQPERAMQSRVIALFRDELGCRYLGDWTEREGNSNIEEGLLTSNLTQCGYAPAQISRAIYLLKTEADSHSRNLYGNNQAVYKLLRYGVPIKTANWGLVLQSNIARTGGRGLKRKANGFPLSAMVWVTTGVRVSLDPRHVRASSVIPSTHPLQWRHCETGQL